jgi:ABC-type Fe3+/spermidine/putrescine transport system ATPase subunit
LDVSRERQVQIAIRPEGLRIQPCGEQAAGALTGRVRNRTFLGGTDRLEIDVDGCLLIADRSSTDAPIEIGADVVLLPDPERIIMFDQADL